MKNIWNISKQFTTKTHEFKTNSTIKNKFIHYDLSIKQKVLNHPNKIPPIINLEKIVENFEKNKDHRQDELDNRISKELLNSKENEKKEIPLNKIIVNEIESFFNQIVSVYSKPEISKVEPVFTKEFDDLEEIDASLSSINLKTKKEIPKDLNAQEKQILELIENTTIASELNTKNFQERKSKDFFMEKYKNDTLQQVFDRNNIKFSTESNNRINLNNKLNLNNKISTTINSKLVVNINNLNDSLKLDYEDQEFNRIRISQEGKAPTLMHDLMVVVNNPGIYKLESIKDICPSNMEFLENLPDPDHINFENLENFVPSDKDANLGMIAKKNNLKYVSSTSGIGSLLNHLFYKLTNFKTPHFYNLSEAYEKEPLKFMLFQRKPTSIMLKKHPDNYYSISGDKMFEHKNYTVLMMMGKYMEKMFTTDPKEFRDKYMFDENKPNNEQVEIEKDYYTFMSFSNTLLRSQIDCIGKTKNNREILFEIKTRAVCPIRYDLENYRDYLDYEIKTLLGRHSSYEREFYDLIRGAFLKYLFQIKIGGMEGAFISYHNTKKIMGFEFIKLEDMQRRIFGNSNFSDIIFKSSLKLLECIFDRVLQDFGSESDQLKIGFFANEWCNTLDVFVEIIYPHSYTDTTKYEYHEFIDYYFLSRYKPTVYKYSVSVFPIVNDILHVFSPLLFEKFDNFGCRYKMKFQGAVSFEEYMKFLHEAYSSDSINIENQYTGSWSGFFQ